MGDSGEYEDPAEQIAAMMAGLGGQLSAVMAEAHRPVRYEYQQTEWEHVNELARAGWLLSPIVIPVAEGFVFVMVRPLGAADEAAELLERAGWAEYGVPPGQA